MSARAVRVRAVATVQDGALTCLCGGPLRICHSRFGLFVLCEGRCGRRETLRKATQRLPENHVASVTVELEAGAIREHSQLEKSCCKGGRMVGGSGGPMCF